MIHPSLMDAPRPLSTPQRVLKLLKDAAPWSGVAAVERFPGGATEGAFLLRLEGGGEAVLKLFPGKEERAVEEERLLLQRLRGAQLPIPEVLPSGSPSGLSDHSTSQVSGEERSDPLYLEGAAATLFSRLPGRSLPDPGERQLGEVARFLGRFHRHSRHCGEGLALLHSRERMERYRSGCTLDLEPLFEEFQPAGEEAEIHGAIHGDLFPDNVLFEGGELSGVVDFSSSGRGSFLFDLAVVALTWALGGDERGGESLPAELERVRLLWREYETESPISFPFATLFPWMGYVSLYFASQRCYRKSLGFSSGPDPEEFLHKLERVRALRALFHAEHLSEAKG